MATPVKGAPSSVRQRSRINHVGAISGEESGQGVGISGDGAVVGLLCCWVAKARDALEVANIESQDGVMAVWLRRGQGMSKLHCPWRRPTVCMEPLGGTAA
jgi:hypothetical protein